MLCVGTKHYIKRLFAELNENIRETNSSVGLKYDEKQIQILQAKANCLNGLEIVLKKEFCINELEDL
jgi:hypothetical protein